MAVESRIVVSRDWRVRRRGDQSMAVLLFDRRNKLWYSVAQQSDYKSQ
jgi:hypothetical protein